MLDVFMAILDALGNVVSVLAMSAGHSNGAGGKPRHRGALPSKKYVV